MCLLSCAYKYMLLLFSTCSVTEDNTLNNWKTETQLHTQAIIKKQQQQKKAPCKKNISQYTIVIC